MCMFYLTCSLLLSGFGSCIDLFKHKRGNLHKWDIGYDTNANLLRVQEASSCISAFFVLAMKRKGGAGLVRQLTLLSLPVNRRSNRVSNEEKDITLVLRRFQTTSPTIVVT